MSFYDLPAGIFNTLLSLWDTILETYIKVFSWVGDKTITIGSYSFSLSSIFFGGGLLAFASWRISLYFIDKLS